MMAHCVQQQQSTGRSRACPARQHALLRPVVCRKPFAAVCKAAAAAAPLSEKEREVLQTYKSSGGDVSKAGLLSLLATAGATKSVPAETVEGALLALEEVVRSSPAGSAANVEGRWWLIFGTATKIRAFQYIPVREEFVLDTAAKTVCLESSIGPFNFYIHGAMRSWRPEAGELDFQFTMVEVALFGNKFWETSPTTKPKTYTFYYVGDKLATARSSAGGLALLVKL